MDEVKREYKIYAHINKVNGKIYIGQTCNKYINQRWRHGEGYKHSPHFYNAIKKFGWDNFEHIILKENIFDYKDADKFERYYIDLHKSNNRKYGYNISDGGSKGRTLSAETREKIRLSKLGSRNPNYHKTASETTKKRLSAAHKGIKQSYEWISKRKRSGNKNGMYGKTHSDEVVNMLRKKMVGGNNPSAKKCYLFSSNSEIKEFDCLSFAYKTINKGTKYCRLHRITGIEEGSENIIFILTESEFKDFAAYCDFHAYLIDDIQERYEAYEKFFEDVKNGTWGNNER